VHFLDTVFDEYTHGVAPEDIPAAELADAVQRNL